MQYQIVINILRVFLQLNINYIVVSLCGFVWFRQGFFSKNECFDASENEKGGASQTGGNKFNNKKQNVSSLQSVQKIFEQN